MHNEKVVLSVWQSYYISYTAQFLSFKTKSTSDATNMHVSFLVEERRILGADLRSNSMNANLDREIFAENVYQNSLTSSGYAWFPPVVYAQVGT